MSAMQWSVAAEGRRRASAVQHRENCTLGSPFLYAVPLVTLDLLVVTLVRC